MTFLDEILAELQAMHAPDDHSAADDRLINVILFFAGALQIDHPNWTAKAAEIVTAYRAVPKWYA